MERLSWQIVVSVLSFMLAGGTVESGWWPLFFGVGIVAGSIEFLCNPVGREKGSLENKE